MTSRVPVAFATWGFPIPSRVALSAVSRRGRLIVVRRAAGSPPTPPHPEGLAELDWQRPSATHAGRRLAQSLTIDQVLPCWMAQLLASPTAL